MQLHRTQLHAILLTLITALPLQAESIGSWSVNKTDASDPLLFSHAGKTLHMLKNLGPVFATSDGQIGPQDYKTQVTAVEENNGKVILKCRATDDDLTADYTLAFTKLPDGAIELIVDGGRMSVHSSAELSRAPTRLSSSSTSASGTWSRTWATTVGRRSSTGPKRSSSFMASSI